MNNYISILTLLGFLMTAPFSQAQNILIGDSNNPNEPSIKINPKNPNIMVAAANIDNVYYSSDMGLTWNSNIMTSSYGVWGDPVIDVDTAGHFYFFHLSNPASGSWIDRIVCQKSTDNGVTWNDGSFTGLNGVKAQDKQWSIIDENTNTIYLSWTQFDEYGSENPAHFSNIMFSKSTDGGITWTPALKINDIDGDCIDGDNTVEGATPALGPNGEIYVSWAGPNGIVFKKSLDQGATWSTEIAVDSMPSGWDYAIPGLSRANGLPITKCDLSGGPNHGTIYINWSDQRNGANDTDVWLAKSTDGGDTWTDPTRVNTDGAGNQQFFSWMDIDQTNGQLWFVFYDRRNYTDTQTDVFLAHSYDGGSTFSNMPISESPFVPQSGVFFGDYTNISVYDNIVRPIWTRLDSGNLSVWTNVTSADDLLASANDLEENSLQTSTLFPNPVDNISYLSFKLHEASDVHIELVDQQGRHVHEIVASQSLEFGKHIFSIDAASLGIKPGIYYAHLQINASEKTLKIVLEE
ncbi:MAG: T9SS type A sorting domain-containing protein [Crocinitomicaceae bacterium]|nr:T9SS type A sorting domain-containing protein [Crocinitomicaceae bacterium]